MWMIFKRGIKTDNEVLAFETDHKKTNKRRARFFQVIHLAKANSLLRIRLRGRGFCFSSSKVITYPH